MDKMTYYWLQVTQFPFGRTGTCGGGIGDGEEAAETREEEDGQRPEKNILIMIMIMIMIMILAVMMIVKMMLIYKSPVEERALYRALE